MHTSYITVGISMVLPGVHLFHFTVFETCLKWNLNQNTKLFIHENAFEAVVCKMVAIYPRGEELIQLIIMSELINVI